MCKMTGLCMNQLNNWFINARRRKVPKLRKQQVTTTEIKQEKIDNNDVGNEQGEEFDSSEDEKEGSSSLDSEEYD